MKSPLLERLRTVARRIRGGAARIPFEVRELHAPDERVDALFRRSFGTPAPREPRHFVATHRRGAREHVVAYIHFTEWRPGVYLCGGLCVDERVYRTLTAPERSVVAARGSLSRWLSDEAISALPAKIAVFAYTGNTRSRRDAAAIGFVPLDVPNLFVQWHGFDSDQQGPLVRAVAELGPF